MNEEDKQEAIRVMKIWAEDGVWPIAVSFFWAKIDPSYLGIKQRGFQEAIGKLAPQLYPIRNPTEEELAEGRRLYRIVGSARGQRDYEEARFRDRNGAQSRDTQEDLWSTFKHSNRNYNGLEKCADEMASKISNIGYGLATE